MYLVLAFVLLYEFWSQCQPFYDQKKLDISEKSGSTRPEFEEQLQGITE